MGSKLRWKSISWLLTDSGKSPLMQCRWNSWNFCARSRPKRHSSSANANRFVSELLSSSNTDNSSQIVLNSFVLIQILSLMVYFTEDVSLGLFLLISLDESIVLTDGMVLVVLLAGPWSPGWTSPDADRIQSRSGTPAGQSHRQERRTDNWEQRPQRKGPAVEAGIQGIAPISTGKLRGVAPSGPSSCGYQAFPWNHSVVCFIVWNSGLFCATPWTPGNIAAVVNPCNDFFLVYASSFFFAWTYLIELN